MKSWPVLNRPAILLQCRKGRTPSFCTSSQTTRKLTGINCYFKADISDEKLEMCCRIFERLCKMLGSWQKWDGPEGIGQSGEGIKSDWGGAFLWLMNLHFRGNRPGRTLPWK